MRLEKIEAWMVIEWCLRTIFDNSPEFKRKSERGKAARASTTDGSLHTGGSMSFAAHQRKLQKLKGGEHVTPAEVFSETHKKKKKTDGTRGDWFETRAKETYEGFQKGLEDWHQTQPPSQDGTAVHPSSTYMNSIWTQVAGGPKKGRVYGLGVMRSSFRPSPLLSNASISQNTEEVEELRKEMQS